jgi:hypothetical protein
MAIEIVDLPRKWWFSIVMYTCPRPGRKCWEKMRSPPVHRRFFFRFSVVVEVITVEPGFYFIDYLIEDCSDCNGRPVFLAHLIGVKTEDVWLLIHTFLATIFSLSCCGCAFSLYFA